MTPLAVIAGRRITGFAPCARCTLKAAMLAALAAITFSACAPRPEQAEIAIELPTEVQRGLEIKWQSVKGADGYRMVFRRMTGAAICTLSVGAAKQPSYVIVRDSLPAGLVHGWQLDMEMHAMRKGEPMAATGTRPLKIP